MNPLATAFLIAALTVTALMLALYGVARRVNKVGVVDVGWAWATGLLAVAVLLAGDGDPVRRAVAAGCIGLWSLRLGTYLLFNRVIGAEEDGRYQAMLDHWGDTAWRKMFWFYLAQAGFAILFAVPMLPVATAPAPFPSLADAAALAVWAVAVLGEGVADRQLARWRAAPEHRGRTCRAGLWRYSRHPNYFFEWLHWWAYVLLALSSPWWWVTLAAPALMLAFLYRFTGIPYTEAQALRSRGEDYRDYQRTTSAFFPWFPRG